MAFVYAFWALAALAVLGAVADVIAVRRGAARRVAIAALVLKGVVVLSFAAWFVALQLRVFSGWGDLAAFAGLIVLSLPVFVAALVCDALVIRALRAG